MTVMKLSLYPVDYILTQGSPTRPWSWSSHFLIMSLLPPEDTNFRPHTFENGGQTENSNTKCFISKSALLLSLLSQNFTVGIELWFHKPETNRKRNLKCRFHYRSKHNTKYLGVNLVKNVQNLYGEDYTVAFRGKILNSELKTSHLIKRIGCAGPPRGSCNGGAFTVCQNTSTHYAASLEDRCELKGHIWPMSPARRKDLDVSQALTPTDASSDGTHTRGPSQCLIPDLHRLRSRRGSGENSLPCTCFWEEFLKYYPEAKTGINITDI